MQPKLDHMIQYQVDRISTHEKQPAIVFENGAKIVLDKKVKAIEELVGARLQSVEDKGDLGGEQLSFKKDQIEIVITLDKGKYRIYDPALDEAIDPHAEIDSDAELPPDPSADRIKDGPTIEEEQGGEEEAAGATE